MRSEEGVHIVVIDDDAAFRDALTRHFAAQGHHAVSFPSVERCLPHLTRARVDLITLDLDMPRIGGMALLTALHKKGHSLPILVISGCAPGDERESIRGMGAHFLAKPFHPKALSEAVKLALGTSDDDVPLLVPAPSEVRDAASRQPTIRERLEAATLPTMDPRLASIQGMLMRPEAPSFETLGVSLGEDPRLVAAVLRMANSTEYRGTAPITSLGAAMARLGAKEVVSIVLQVLVRGIFVVNDKELRVMLDACWERAVACAHAAKKLASLTPRITPDDAYVFGLLHDIGQLAVCTCLDGAGLDGEQAQKYVDQYHEAVGARLLSEWGMPRVIVGLARVHHDSSRMSDEVALVTLAHESLSEEGVTSVELMERLGLTQDRVEALIAA